MAYLATKTLPSEQNSKVSPYSHGCLLYSTMHNILTLDSTTLFYWDLSNNLKKCKFSGRVVSQWAQFIPCSAQADSCANKHIPTQNRHPTSLNSVNEDVILDKRHLCVQEGAVISDKDEMEGEEHEDAVKSHPKVPGVCVSSEVSYPPLQNYFLT